MREIKNTIVVIMLVFIAVLMLIASLEYSSNIINDGSEPVDYYSSGAGSQNNGNGTPSEASPAKNDDKPGTGIDLTRLPSRGDEVQFDPFAASQDSGMTLVIIAVVAVVLAAIATIAYWIMRKRRRKQDMAAVPAEAPGMLSDSPGSFEGRYKLRFPQIRNPLPFTWGADEPLEMIIACNDATGGEARLSVDGGEARTIRLEGGNARVALRLAKGPHRIMVSSPDSGMSGKASWADVQIVDYREEIVRIFNELCQRLKSVDAGVRDEMTPRELERSVGERMPERGDAIDMAVTVFEYANYSTHAIRRSDYERMYLSGMELT